MHPAEPTVADQPLPPGAERRQAPRESARRPCLVRTDYAPSAAPWRGYVLDISARGVGVLLPGRLPVTTVLTLTPLGWDLPPALVGRVVHAEPLDGGWLHGCELLRELSDEHVRLWRPWSAARALDGPLP